MPQVIIGGESYDKIVVVNTSGTDIGGGGGGGGGDASAANQVTGNNTLASINGKLPALVGDATAANQVTGNNSLAAINGKLTAGTTSTENSTTTNLAANGVFTGSAWIDTLNYSQIAVGITSSHASATDGLQIQQSTDAATVSSVDLYSIPATTSKIFNIIPNLRYVRVVYTNGATLTTSLSIQTNLRVYAQPGSVQRPQDARTNDNDFLENICYSMGFNGTTWDRLRSTIANGLLTDVSRIVAALPAGANTIGGVIDKPTTTGGTLTTKILSSASTNAGVAKASAGQVYGLQFNNSGAAVAFVKLYNKATAPTVGTDAVVDIIAIPAGGSREVNRPLGMAFAAGIAYAITGGFADADTTAVTAGQVVGSIQYF